MPYEILEHILGYLPAAHWGLPYPEREECHAYHPDFQDGGAPPSTFRKLDRLADPDAEGRAQSRAAARLDFARAALVNKHCKELRVPSIVDEHH